MIGLVTFCSEGQTWERTPHPALTLRCHDMGPCTARETPHGQHRGEWETWMVKKRNCSTIHITFGQIVLCHFEHYQHQRYQNVQDPVYDNNTQRRTSSTEGRS